MKDKQFLDKLPKKQKQWLIEIFERALRWEMSVSISPFSLTDTEMPTIVFLSKKDLEKHRELGKIIGKNVGILLSYEEIKLIAESNVLPLKVPPTLSDKEDSTQASKSTIDSLILKLNLTDEEK